MGNSDNVGGNTFRPPTEVMLQFSNAAGMGFRDVQLITPSATATNLAQPLVARYVRLVILSADNEDQADSVYIGVSG